jgi:predicted N-formylglutamate amidohydrolase
MPGERPAVRAALRPAARPIAVVVTCEHGGNRVPRRYARWFRGGERLLASHRGWDPGALTIARALARALGAPLVASTVSRLVVELNRSPHHPRLFSDRMRAAPAELRATAFNELYVPHRRRVEALVRQAIARGRFVVHIASHSFTPVLRGQARRTDVGLLYDPSRRHERALCVAWQRALRARAPESTVRRNHPYRGTSDGLTRALRQRFGDTRYAGIELEVNQRRMRGTSIERWRRLLVASFVEALASIATPRSDVNAARRRAPARRGGIREAA